MGPSPPREVMWRHSTMRPEGDLSRVRRNRDAQKKAMPKIYEIGGARLPFRGRVVNPDVSALGLLPIGSLIAGFQFFFGQNLPLPGSGENEVQAVSGHQCRREASHGPGTPFGWRRPPRTVARKKRSD